MKHPSRIYICTEFSAFLQLWLKSWNTNGCFHNVAHPVIDVREATRAINAHDWAVMQSTQLRCDEEEVIKLITLRNQLNSINGETYTTGDMMYGNWRYWLHYGFRMYYEFRMQEGECLEEDDIVIVTRCGKTLTEGSRWYFGSLVRNGELIPNRWFPPGVVAPLRDSRFKGTRDFKASLLCQYTHGHTCCVTPSPPHRHHKWSRQSGRW